MKMLKHKIFNHVYEFDDGRVIINTNRENDIPVENLEELYKDDPRRGLFVFYHFHQYFNDEITELLLDKTLECKRYKLIFILEKDGYVSDSSPANFRYYFEPYLGSEKIIFKKDKAGNDISVHELLKEKLKNAQLEDFLRGNIRILAGESESFKLYATYILNSFMTVVRLPQRWK